MSIVLNALEQHVEQEIRHALEGWVAIYGTAKEYDIDYFMFNRKEAANTMRDANSLRQAASRIETTTLQVAPTPNPTPAPVQIVSAIPVTCCLGKKANGEPCTFKPKPGTSHCKRHTPADSSLVCPVIPEVIPTYHNHEKCDHIVEGCDFCARFGNVWAPNDVPRIATPVPTEPVDHTPPVTQTFTKKKRGRPAGSKNKPKAAPEPQATPEPQAAPEPQAVSDEEIDNEFANAFSNLVVEDSSEPIVPTDMPHLPILTGSDSESESDDGLFD